MYLIDTDIIVFALRGEEQVLRGIEEHAAAPKAISVITYGELLYGAKRSARPRENAERVGQVASLFPIMDVSPRVMETFASLKHEMAGTGVRLDDFDLAIAATAMTLGFTLVTNNEKHFRKVPGLRTENWARPLRG